MGVSRSDFWPFWAFSYNVSKLGEAVNGGSSSGFAGQSTKGDDDARPIISRCHAQDRPSFNAG